MPPANEARYCSKCFYDLRGLNANRCPECGAEYDPSDPTTFSPRPKHGYWREILRRSSSPWIVIPAVWLTYYEIVSGYLMIPLLLFGVIGAVGCRRPVAALLILMVNPLTYFFARGSLDYFEGTAKLREIGLPSSNRGNIDPTYRCEWTYVNPKIGFAERVCCLSYNAAVKLDIHVFGHMPGSYTGPYPSPGEVQAALKNARPIDLDQLAADRVAIDSTAILLEEGQGREWVISSIWSRAWSEHADTTPSAARPPIAAGLTPDGCLVISIPVQQPDAIQIDMTILVVDPESGRPFLRYRQ